MEYKHGKYEYLERHVEYEICNQSMDFSYVVFLKYKRII